MGGKGRIVDDILPIMLSNYNGNTFVDIFCGGCSVIEHVPNTYRRIANDKQKYLIAMWRVLTTSGIPPMRIERDYYCDVRDSYNKNNENYPDWIKGWVGFMGSFNGRFFDGDILVIMLSVKMVKQGIILLKILIILSRKYPN